MLRTLKARLAQGRVTEDDPRGGTALRWLPVVREPAALVPGVCPTKALQPGKGILDLRACIHCDGCGRAGVVTWTSGVPDIGQGLVPLAPGASPDALPALAKRWHAMQGVFGRSLAVRHVDAGSCNGCDTEIHALASPFTDLERFGIRFVASPRHADVLLVTGVATRNLADALRRTVAATPHPRAVVALGACALSGGIFADSPHVLGGVHTVVEVDVVVPGCPPPPEAILAGLLEAARILGTRLLPRGEPGTPAS